MPPILIFFARQRVLARQHDDAGARRAAQARRHSFVTCRPRARGMLRKDVMTTIAPPDPRRRRPAPARAGCSEARTGQRASRLRQRRGDRGPGGRGGRRPHRRTAGRGRRSRRRRRRRSRGSTPATPSCRSQRVRAERAAADAQLRLLQAGSRAEDIRQAEAQVRCRGRRRRGDRGGARRRRSSTSNASRRCCAPTPARASSATTRRRGWTWRANAGARRTERVRAARETDGAAASGRAPRGDRRRAGAGRRRGRADRHAREEPERREVIAPVAGIVTQKLVDAGEIVARGRRWSWSPTSTTRGPTCSCPSR